jgi:putative transposase
LRFKGKGWFKTFSYNQSGFNIFDEGRRYTTLHLSKIGVMRMRIGNKQNRPKGEVKQITIKKTKTNKWFAFVISDEKFKREKRTHKKVGIDLGLEHYAYDSDGNHFDNPKYLRESEDRLKWYHKQLSRTKKGSKNREKAKLRLSKVHEHIENQRIDFCHKLSHYYVKNYDFIALEDLQIPNMVQNHHLSKSILDASWSMFTNFISYKVERTDRKLKFVNPNYTSQICSSCGRLVKKTLATRTHKCECGLNVHRDYNSAKNILKIGIGKELPQYTPVEIRPLLNEQVMVRETGSHLR